MHTEAALLSVEQDSKLEKAILAKAKDILAHIDNCIDLFPFYSILVSSGWNKNTDVFDPVELWKARHSPEDKPLNYMHDQSRIIGHIVQNMVVDENLDPVSDQLDEGDLPNKIHIITASVLYRIWEDPFKQDHINELMNKIVKGHLYVSMECLFRNFDFALKSAQGQKLIQRTSETDHLVKYLRQYKGTGKLNEYDIGRLLRQITFSAVGLVDNPANPESIISNSLNLFKNKVDQLTSLGYINLDPLTGEHNMADTKLEGVVTELKAFDIESHPIYKTLASNYEKVVKERDDLHQASAVKDKEYKDKLEKDKADLEVALSAKDKELDKEKAAKETMETECASLKADNETMKKTLEAYKKAEKSSARASAIMAVDKKLNLEQATKLVTLFNDVSDPVFTNLVSTMAGYVTTTPVNETSVTDVIDSATADLDAPLGSDNESEQQTLASQVKAWLKPSKGK